MYNFQPSFMLACRLQLPLSPHDFEAPDLTTLRYVISLGLGSSSSQWAASHSRSTRGGPATSHPVVDKKKRRDPKDLTKYHGWSTYLPMKICGYFDLFDFENWWEMILDCGLGEITGRCYAFGRFTFGRALYSKIRFEIRDLFICLFVNVHYLNMFRYRHEFKQWLIGGSLW